MNKNLVIMGIDPGIRHFGACRITCTGPDVYADAVEVVRTDPNRSLRSADDQARRLRALFEVMRAVRGEAKIDILAYEYYRPFANPDGFRAGHGSLVAKAEGLAIGFGFGHGAALVPVGPQEAKRALGVHDKEGAAKVLEGKIVGLSELLDSSGRAGHHGSDAVAVAHCALLKAFSAALKRS